MSKKIKLRSIVLIWTLLTTTFFWTSTMRLLLKPEISSWRIFNVGGEGSLGDFWFPPLIVLIALFLFYIEGRGQLRFIYHILLISWHLLLTGAMVYGTLQSESKISFGTWGIQLDFIWMVIPFTVFLILSVVLIIQEVRNPSSIPAYRWSHIDLKSLGIAVILFPIAYIFFEMGTGFNWLVKIAVIVTIIQWIIIIESLDRPNLKEPKILESES